MQSIGGHAGYLGDGDWVPEGQRTVVSETQGPEGGTQHLYILKAPR